MIDHRATYGESICPYCGVGCRLWAEVAYGRVLRVKGAEAPANRGGICAKGATLEQTIEAPDRLLHPMVRRRRSDQWQGVTWDVATSYVARKIAETIQQHGPDSVGFYGSGQLDSQAVYAAVKLFKGWLGTNNTDSNSRLCMASAVAAYRTSLGSDGPPTCYADIDDAQTIVIAGSNMAEAHPVTFDRIKAARKANPDFRLIVIDPRRSTTADHADLHVPVRAGGDIALFNAVGRLLLERGAIDEQFIKAHTSGSEEYLTALAALDLNAMIEACGVERETLEQMADLLAGRRWLSFYCMGLGQSTLGMWKINSLINLHLLTGSIAQPGCGPFSLTGQPNAMGGREIGLLSHQLPGYRFVENANDRAEVEKYWNLPAGKISPKPGLTAVEMFRALETGKLKVLWIAATNPAVSLPDLHQVHRAMQQADFVIVQDAYHPTETTRFADVVLPAASWGEREWMSTNSERMVSFSEALIAPPGASKPDWAIVCEVAKALGARGFDFASAEEVWNEWIGLTRGRMCDMSGMTYERLKTLRNLQWPCPEENHPGSERLYSDRRFAHADGKAAFHFRPHRGPKEDVDHEFPLRLTTGRLYAHWHTLTRTAKSKQLWRRDNEPFVQIHPELAGQLAVEDGDAVQVMSRRGTVRLKAQVSDRVPPDTIFLPMHWGDLYAPDAAINYLTLSAIGRVAKQPELKHCAVTVEKAAPSPETNGHADDLVPQRNHPLSWLTRSPT